MLENITHYNDLSPKLMEKLEKQIASFGKYVIYKFHIDRPDPHPDNRGKTIYPRTFELGPVTWRIMDKEEDRKDKSKQKTIALIKTTGGDGKPDAFHRIAVHDFQRGLLRLELDRVDDIRMAMAIELHPKLNGGMFQDKNTLPVISRLDELATSKANRANRKTKTEAMYAAQNFSDQQIRDFVCGMNWDETENMDILREKVEKLAEEQPGLFTEHVNAPSFLYKAIVKRAFDQQIIIYVPVENKVIWGSNQQTLVILDRVEGDDKNEVDRMAEWLLFANNGAEVHKKLKALI